MDMPWWGWLIGAVVAFYVSTLSKSSSKGERDYWAMTLMVASAIAGIACLAMGVIRFMNWVWVG